VNLKKRIESGRMVHGLTRAELRGNLKKRIESDKEEDEEQGQEDAQNLKKRIESDMLRGLSISGCMRLVNLKKRIERDDIRIIHLHQHILGISKRELKGHITKPV